MQNCHASTCQPLLPVTMLLGDQTAAAMVVTCCLAHSLRVTAAAVSAPGTLPVSIAKGCCCHDVLLLLLQKCQLPWRAAQSSTQLSFATGE
jgi:hypothetical protein